MARTVLTILCILLMAPPLQASLFSKRINESEYAKYKLKSPAFAEADRELNSAYRDLMAIAGEEDRRKIKEAQGNWIVQRDEKAYDAAFKGGDEYLGVLASLTAERAKLFREVIADEKRHADSIRAARIEAERAARQARLDSIASARHEAEAAAVKKTENDQGDQLVIAFMAIALVGVAILIGGAANRVVIYYDMSDMGNSFLAVALPVAAMMLFGAEPFHSESYNHVFQWTSAIAAGLGGAVCIFGNFASSVRNNRSIVVGLFIGVFKIAFVSISALAAIEQVSTIFNRNKSFREASIAGLVLVVIGLMAKSMVNGPRVYEARGWNSKAAEGKMAVNG